MEFVKMLEGWGIPLYILIGILGIFLILQIIGEIGTAAGKTFPVFMQICTHIKEKKKEKADAAKEKINQEKSIAETLKAVKEQQQKVELLLTDVQQHYSADNITMRDRWMLDVNCKMKWIDERAKVYDESVKNLTDLRSVVEQLTDDVKLNNEMTAQMYKDINRNRILDFSHTMVNNSRKPEGAIYSEEEISKIREIYDDYERFLARYGGTNGQVDNAMKVIDRAERGELPGIRIVHDLRDI